MTLTQIQTEAREEMFSILNPERFTATDYLNIGGMIDSLIATAYQLGKDAAVEYIKSEAGIEADMSPVNDYVIPYKLLEQARSV